MVGENRFYTYIHGDIYTWARNALKRSLVQSSTTKYLEVSDPGSEGRGGRKEMETEIKLL